MEAEKPDDTDFRSTIVPKSDQLNYDDVQNAPINVLITKVTKGSVQQPAVIHIEGYQPFKPCTSMRRALIKAWPGLGRDWVGKQLTLYGDPTALWQGKPTGGVRISHFSHIPEPFEMLMTISRNKRVLVKFGVLKTRADECREWLKKNNITLEVAEKAIGKKLDLATTADFSIIGKLGVKK